jgi:predicted ArsR family transcriptional regulator
MSWERDAGPGEHAGGGAEHAGGGAEQAGGGAEQAGGGAEHGAKRELPPGFRELTDPRTMRALAHPTRLSLLELMSQEGSVTVTRASEVLGESTASCSYHIRQLAKYGFVEPAGGGRGRERPWRRATRGQSWDEIGDDPETRAAAETLTSIVVERHMGRVARWLDERRREPAKWREVTGFSDRLLYLTAEELADLDRRIFDVVEATGYAERTADPTRRPPDARAISLIVFGIPAQPPGA